MSLSNYSENKLIDHLLGKGTRNFTSPSTLAVDIFSAQTGTESIYFRPLSVLDQLQSRPSARKSAVARSSCCRIATAMR